MPWYLPGDPRGKYWGESDEQYWARTKRAEEAKAYVAKVGVAGLGNNAIQNPGDKLTAGPGSPTNPGASVTTVTPAVKPSPTAGVDELNHPKAPDVAISGSIGDDTQYKPPAPAAPPPSTAPAAPTVDADSYLKKILETLTNNPPESQYNKWLERPEVKAAQAQLSQQYTDLAGTANPYSADNPEFAKYVTGQQQRAALGFGTQQQRLLGQLAGQGATSGGVAAARASLAGRQAGGLQDIALRAYEQQYANQADWDRQKRSDLAGLAGQAANVGLNVGQLGVSATGQRFGQAGDLASRIAGLQQNESQFGRELGQRGSQFTQQQGFNEWLTQQNLKRQDRAQNNAWVGPLLQAIGVIGGGAVGGLVGGPPGAAIGAGVGNSAVSTLRQTK